MPAAVALAIQGLLALVQVAPGVVSIVEKVKALFKELADQGLITPDLQNALWARVDADLALFRNGFVPPEYQVQPDPPAVDLAQPPNL